MDKRTYNTIHKYLSRKYTKQGVCEFCGKLTKTEWSTKTGVYDRTNRAEWQELCKQCHFRYDIEVLGALLGENRRGMKYGGKPGFASFSKEKLAAVSAKGGRNGKRT